MSRDIDEQDIEEDIYYRFEDRLPLGETILLGFQHMLIMFVGIITPPLIIVGVAGLNAADSAFFVNMALIVSGVTSYIQCRKMIRLVLDF